jgi:hypothetical protein
MRVLRTVSFADRRSDRGFKALGVGVPAIVLRTVDAGLVQLATTHQAGDAEETKSGFVESANKLATVSALLCRPDGRRSR